MGRYWYMLFADALLTLASVVFGLMLRLELVYPGSTLFSLWLGRVWPFIILAMLTRPAVFYFRGIYKKIWRYASTQDFIALAVSIVIGSIILSIATMFVLYPFWTTGFPRSLLIFEGLISLFLLGGLRVILKTTEQYSGDINWKNISTERSKRILVVGAGNTGVNMAREFLTNPQLGLQPVAFLDDDNKKIGLKIENLTIYGPLIRLDEVVKDNKIDEVIIAIPSAPVQTIQNIKNICQSIQIPFSTVPFLSSFIDRIEKQEGPSPSPLKLPMAMPDITAEEIRTVVHVMQSRNLSIGSQTLAFEKLIAEEAHAKEAVAVINGTAALHLCIVAADIGPDDEVITSPFSFISSANCILYERARPVFVDVDPATYNIAPGKIETAITKRTRAILAVHIFGQPANMDPIMDIAAKHNLIVIEDACEAIGAKYKGRKVGAIGKAGTFAFYPNKQITTGEGAVLVTNDEAWAHLFRSLRNQGRDQFDGWLNHSRLGYNYRMSELNAAVGVVQIRRLAELLDKREKVAQQYNKALNGLENVNTLTIAPETTQMSWFVYVVRFSPGIDRNRLIDLMARRGVPTRPYFTPIHLQQFYQKRFGFQRGDFPEAEAAGESTLALPFHANMKTEEIEVVCRALAESLAELKH